MECRFPRRIDALRDVFAFASEFVTQRELHMSETQLIELVLEELFKNFVQHNREGGSEIRVTLDVKADVLEIAVTDFGVEHFDPTTVPAVDVTAPLEARDPGGLGIHFVRQVADEVRYEYVDGNSTVTATKRMRS